MNHSCLTRSNKVLDLQAKSQEDITSYHLRITIGKIDDEWIGVTRGVGMAYSSIGKHMGPGWWYYITSDQLDSLDS